MNQDNKKRRSFRTTFFYMTLSLGIGILVAIFVVKTMGMKIITSKSIIAGLVVVLVYILGIIRYNRQLARKDKEERD